jgi:serine/threonine protein kinase
MAPDLHGEVRRVFDAALEQPETERMAFLQATCGGEPEVFQSVVRLLEARQGSQSFLEDGRPSQRIGRYMVAGELGRGAMGIVYEAFDPLIGRKVAVKVINLQDFADAGKARFLRDRLFREARSAGALSHPGIVVVFDVGQEGDLAFIAMERVEGVSLYHELASGRKMPRTEAFNILRQAAAALDYAHRNGVVHRDIKPANILLDKGVTVKVADFGIAKIASMERQTLTSAVMGTPSYMSPEQIEVLPSDGRSDQFSLAVVAYELLTGSRPFEADSLAALAHMIVYAERPSARAVNPELPAAVDVVVQRSLARLPGDRYSSCTEFVAALEEASQDAPRPLLPQLNAEEPTQTLIRTPAPESVGAGKKRTSRAAVSFGNLLRAGIALLALLGGLFLYKALSPNRNPPGDPPHIVKFVADPPSIESGSPAALRWDVTGATEVVLNQGIGKVAASGTFEVSPREKTSYVLTATGPAGKVSARVSLNVRQGSSRDARASRLCADAEAKWAAHQAIKATELFRQAASLGEPQCMDELGEISMDDNPVEAVQWFRKAAEAGNPSGMRHLGGMYQVGIGLLMDYDMAAFWYGQAADKGNADAMYNLGSMYESGQGVAKDPKAAKELYFKAAKLGNAEAKARLALLNGN